MTPPPAELSQAVARADWAALVPAHRQGGEELPSGSPSLLDALALGPGLWLGVVADDRGHTYPVPLVALGSVVRRAGAGDGAAEALLDVLRLGPRRQGGFAVTTWHAEPAEGEQPVLVDQTNESVVVGGRAVVKWAFRAEPGPHPAPQVVGALVERRFSGMPQPWGFVEWRPDHEAAPRLAVSVVTFLPGVEDGWTWAVDVLRNAVHRGCRAHVVEAGTSTGELVAQLHLALAEEARPATDGEVQGWKAAAEVELADALRTARGSARELLLSAEHRMRAAWRDGWRTAGARSPLVTRVHGDLHVGQLLRQPSVGAGGGHRYVVTDFDGNPVVPPDQRLALQPAALDVAGMVQSFEHVGLVLRRHEPHHDSASTARMVGELREAFLAGYRATLTGARRLELLEPALLRPFRLQQVCREFRYAATHLPRWEYVPVGALPALLEEDDR